MAQRHDDFPLPDLRFVAVESLVPHEQFDEHRMEPLKRMLLEQTHLKNPPVVAPLDADQDAGAAVPRYVVLDGANRSSAARAAGFPHMLVQVVEYEEPHVRLMTWYHALTGLTAADLEEALHDCVGLECKREERIHARALLARREALACIATGGPTVLTLVAPGADLEQKNQYLNRLVGIYRRRAFTRVTSDHVESVRQRIPGVTALVLFPHFEPDEILELAMVGARMPAGITRHVIRWRALRVNLPVERLADRTQMLDEKNTWLRNWLADHLARREVRFYEEPTVLFDE